jgi:hypothetical protein
MPAEIDAPVACAAEIRRACRTIVLPDSAIRNHQMQKHRILASQRCRDRILAVGLSQAGREGHYLSISIKPKSEPQASCR